MDVCTCTSLRLATLLKNVAVVAKFFQIWSDKCLMDFNYLKGQTNQPREIWIGELGVSSITSCYYVRRVNWSEKWHFLFVSLLVIIQKTWFSLCFYTFSIFLSYENWKSAVKKCLFHVFLLWAAILMDISSLLF